MLHSVQDYFIIFGEVIERLWLYWWSL